MASKFVFFSSWKVCPFSYRMIITFFFSVLFFIFSFSLLLLPNFASQIWTTCLRQCWQIWSIFVCYCIEQNLQLVCVGKCWVGRKHIVWQAIDRMICGWWVGHLKSSHSFFFFFFSLTFWPIPPDFFLVKLFPIPLITFRIFTR